MGNGTGLTQGKSESGCLADFQKFPLWKIDFVFGGGIDRLTGWACRYFGGVEFFEKNQAQEKQRGSNAQIES